MARFVLIASGPCYYPVTRQVVEEFVSSYSPEAFDGRGDVVLTTDVSKAQEFASIDDAQNFVMQIPKNRPTRADGQPNRPIRAFVITFHELTGE